MKVHNLAAQFDFQPVFRDSKLDNIRVFFLICQRLSATGFNHVTPAEDQGAVSQLYFHPFWPHIRIALDQGGQMPKELAGNLNKRQRKQSTAAKRLLAVCGSIFVATNKEARCRLTIWYRVRRP
jgi:hypothetical protein